MSMGDVPVRPYGLEPIHIFCQRVWEKLWGRGRLVDSPDILISETARGTALELRSKPQQQQAAAGTGIQLFKIDSIQGDYMTGKVWNPSTQDYGLTTYCAKLPKMRSSVTSESIDGNTITYSYGGDATGRTRTASNISIGSPESQVLVPRLNVGDIIEVGKILQGAAPGWTPPLVGPDSKPIELIDLGESRYWAKKAGTI